MDFRIADIFTGSLDHCRLAMTVGAFHWNAQAQACRSDGVDLPVGCQPRALWLISSPLTDLWIIKLIW